MDRGRRQRIILFALLALGIALRLRQYAACPSYWYDEAYLLRNIFGKSCGELLGPLSDDQAAPPLFLWCLRGLYRGAGGSEGWMRLPALLASLVGLFVLVPLARRVAGRGWLWAVAFAALGHHAAAHAGEVKPYAVDFLVAELILLAALRCQSPVSGWRDRLGLGLLAVLAPWLSYPAVFVLGGACLALLVRASRCQPAAQARNKFILACAAGWLSAVSALLLWQIAVRHQTSESLRTFWAASFVDCSSPGAALAWLGRCLIEIGNYGTREMGLPLLVLAIIGAISLMRRRPARVVLLEAPLGLALSASALRCYPLGGRLVFFLVPCVWLLAARGITALIQRCPRRMTWLVRLAPIALLIPAALWAGRFLISVTPRCQFREAFAYVEQQRRAGDVLWVSHPQVYEVYYGRRPELSGYAPATKVERAARTGRLWMVCAVAGSRQRPTAPETVARLRALTCRVLARRRFKGLEVVLTAPPERK